MPHDIASMTAGFSYAYLKEAYIASLLTHIQSSHGDAVPAEEEEDPELGRFGTFLRQQVALLREDIAE